MVVLTWLFITSNALAFIPKSFTGIFEQRYYSAVTQKEKRGEGKMFYQYPGKIRLEVTQPEDQKSTYVTDGKTIWYYTPAFMPGEQGELVEQKVKSGGGHGRFFDALTKGLTSNKIYQVSFKDKMALIVFNPEARKLLDVASAELNFKQKASANLRVDDLIDMKLTYHDGKKVTLKLSHLQKEVVLAPSSFEFRPPPGTKITTN